MKAKEIEQNTVIGEKKPGFRAAVISDVHIGFTGHLDPHYCGLGQRGDQDLWWEYTLRWFKNEGVDAVIVPGDMTNACDYDIPSWSADYSLREMYRFHEIFNRVFTGTETQLISIYGNHDQFVQDTEKLNGGSCTPWKDVFQETYSHVFIRKVNGYTFVCANWGYESEAVPFVAEAARKSNGRPVFYMQHGAIANTTTASDPKRDHEIFQGGTLSVKDHLCCVAFTGHTHAPLTDERCIWQAADPESPKCTVISCSSLNYGCPEIMPVNGESCNTKHAMLMDVCGNRITLRRLNFYTDEMLALTERRKTEQIFRNCTTSCGKDWIFTSGEGKPYDPVSRAADAKPIQFPPTATAGVYRGDRELRVTFPAAIPPDTSDNMLFSYRIECTDFEGKLCAYTELATENHIDHDQSRFSSRYTAFLHGLKGNTEYTVSIYPRDCYLNLGKPLTLHTHTLESPVTELR